MLKTIYKILEKPNSSKHGELVQKLLFFNVIVNIFVVLSSVVFDFSSKILSIFYLVEVATVGIFVVELLTRYIVVGCDSRYSGILGRVKFTFTPFIIIDILSLLPYMITGIEADILIARTIRFLRFFRVLKLIRLRSIVKKFFSISAFATSSIATQVVVLFIFSVSFIVIFSSFYSEDKMSLMIFLDPVAIAETMSNKELVFGIVELMIGLFIGGALISIITELLSNITSTIKNGYYPYKEKDHIVIINHNNKLKFILEEINQYYKDVEIMQDIVIFLPFVDDIDSFRQNQNKYTNLKIIVATGEELNWNSYSRINLNFAKKVMILQDLNQDTNYLNVKITRYILSHSNFNNGELEFVIEIEDDKTLSNVYAEIFRNNKNSYLTVEPNSIIERILSRSIIEPEYFKIYSTLFSFKGYELYRIDAKDVIKEDITFEQLYKMFSQGILIGIRKDGVLNLNPAKDTIITKEDKIVTLLENKLSYSIDNSLYHKKNFVKLQHPDLKMEKYICIVGDYGDIQKENISDFLTTQSIKNIETIIMPNNKYMDDELWNRIIEKNYDSIILNIEDDYELMLTLYLRDKYRKNTKFLSSIINIIKDPITAKLLEDKTIASNIILSEKLVGKYMAQILFNHGIADIFNELTQSFGNEFYILTNELYEELYNISLDSLKLTLLSNDMIYIGVLRDGEFIVDSPIIKNTDKIVILASGKIQN